MEDEATERDLNIRVHMHDEDTSIRYTLAERLREIAGSIQDGFKTAGVIRDASGNKIGEWELS